MDENADGGVVTAVATDNADSVSVDNDHFEVADGNLKLKAGSTLDFESDTSPIEVTITASGAGGDATATVTVSINDVNEMPSIDVRDGEEVPGHAGVISSLTVAENAMKADIAPLALIEVMDPDAADQDHLKGDAGIAAITLSGDAADHFDVVLDPEMGLWLHLAEGASLNYEDGDTVMVTVTFTDSAGNTASQDVTVTVTDVNEAPYAPTVVNADDLSVDENDAGASVTSIDATMDPEGDEDITYHVDDDRFEIDGGRVLKLKDGMILDHETEGYVMLNITATDSDGNESEATAVTVHVNDVNEGPDVVGSVSNIALLAGDDGELARIDLKALFDDPDAGDQPVSFELHDHPPWLRMSVEYGTNADGEQTITGILRSVTGSGRNPESPAPIPAGDDSVTMVSIVATDGGSESGRASFYVVVDDGNDVITGIDLYQRNADGSDGGKNDLYEVQVDENDDSGVVFGRVMVEDGDDPRHPNGMHDLAVSDRRFEIKEGLLMLKAGESLDRETDGAAMDIMITATDGPLNSKGQRTEHETKQTVTVLINDKNDAPTANAVGDWWVTINRDFRASDVTEGQYLSFRIENQVDDAKPAFEDQDVGAGGDALTYSISGSGASWLVIDPKDGTIENAAGMLPQPGKYSVTVTATDMGANRDEKENTDGLSASVNFQVIVAHSRPDETGALVADNDDPLIANDQTFDYTEGSSGRVRVATFTVRDDDLSINPHPFGDLEVGFTAKRPGGDDGEFDAVFELSDPRPAGSNMWRYDLFARDDPKTTKNELGDLNYETVREIDILLTASDGIEGGDDTRELRLRITDRQEEPEFKADSTTSTTLSADTKGIFFPVEQEEEGKVTLYLNLSELWSDPDEDDLSGASRFTVKSNVPWAEVTLAPSEWRDVDEVQDVDENGNPRVDDRGRAVLVDRPWREEGDSDDPDTTDIVAIVEIDRTAMGDNTQSDDGLISLTARDAARTGKGEIQLRVTDENIDIPGASDDAFDVGVVSIRGVARQGSELQAVFNYKKDPDLANGASPALVIYTWNEVDVEGTTETVGSLLQSGPSDRLRLTDAQADKKIQVSVTYYEAFHNPTANTHNFVQGNSGVAVTARSAVVQDRNDEGKVTFNLLTDGSTITANAVISDDDGVDRDEDPAPPAEDDDDGTPPTYTWEESANGRGGWTRVDADEPNDDKDDTSNQTLDISEFYRAADADGKFLRVVVEYTDEAGFSERHVSDPIQFGALKDPTPAQTASITGTLAVGGTLLVDSGGGSVQWQRAQGDAWIDIPGATGNLQLTSDHQGETLRAVVTYRDNDGSVTARVAVTQADTDGDGTATETIALAPRGNSAPVSVGESEFTAQVGDIFEETVPMASLFQDADGGPLSFSLTSVDSDLGIDVVEDGTPGTVYVYTGNEQIVTFNAKTGVLTHRSDPDKTHTHDGDNTVDGGGNVLTFGLRATDAGGRGDSSTQVADVHLRINVEPTGITFTNANGTVLDTPGQVDFRETTKASPTPIIVARLNVLDENETDHSFGTHTVTVDDNRFEVVQGTYDRATNPTGPKPDQDGSTLFLVLKAGVLLDHEAEDKDANPQTPTTIKLTLRATDGEGLSTPVRPPIELTVVVINVPEKGDPTAPTREDVPGLKDDDNNNNDIEADTGPGDGDPDESDGGLPPPPGASIGGIIEDFVGDMDGLEQDLLEDFMLVIDDGIEIA